MRKFINHENITMSLISLGLPLIAFMYFGWREAVTVAIITQISIGVLAIRNS